MDASAPDGRQRSRRTAKACETCRFHRTRCTGVVPCTQCVVLGLEDSCTVRAKARQRRTHSSSVTTPPMTVAPPTAPVASTSYRTALGEPTAHFIARTEKTVDDWLESNGHAARLSMPRVPRIAELESTPLPTHPVELAALEDRLIAASRLSEVNNMEFITADRVYDLYSRHRALPGSLAPDQRALVAACLCMGRLTELAIEFSKDDVMRMRPILPDSTREDVEYYRIALRHLDAQNSPSTTSLCALHCLVLFATLVGGPEDARELLGHMSWQTRELGLLRRETAAAYPPQDHAASLGTSTLYKDAWYATLCDAPPFARCGQYDVDDSVGPDVTQHHSQSILWRLALLENELLTQVHSGRVDTTTPDFVLDVEGRWWPLMRECGDEHSDRQLSAVHPYADIHFNWIRLLVRAPLMSHTRLGPSSSPIVARSLSRILHTYGGINAKGWYFPCWSQLRRIVTCGQLLVLCHNARELGRAEAEALFATLITLLKEHIGTFSFIDELIHQFKSVAGILGLELPEETGPPQHFVEQLLFDPSVLAWFPSDPTIPAFANGAPDEPLHLWPTQLGIGEHT